MDACKQVPAPCFGRFFGTSLVIHLLLFSGIAARQMSVGVASPRSTPIVVELSDMDMRPAEAPPAARALGKAPLLTPAPRTARGAPPQPAMERSVPKPEPVQPAPAQQPASASTDAASVSAPSAPAATVSAGAAAGGSTGGRGMAGSGSPPGGGSGSSNGVQDVAFGGADGPSFLSRVVPSYPLAARRMGREGKVLLRLTLDEGGRLLQVDVLQNPGYGFADAALEAVRKSRFLPARSGNRPVACRVRLPIRFALQTGD